MWSERIIKLSYAQLHSFAINGNITAKAVMEQESLQDIFHLPLSEEAYEQLCELDIIMQSLQLTGEKDTWSYI
jgi:hypothetical protein